MTLEDSLPLTFAADTLRDKRERAVWNRAETAVAVIPLGIPLEVALTRIWLCSAPGGVS